MSFLDELKSIFNDVDEHNFGLTARDLEEILGLDKRVLGSFLSDSDEFEVVSSWGGKRRYILSDKDS